MFWHENISRNAETLSSARLFENLFGNILGCVCAKDRLTTIAAEGDEMEVLCLLITF